MLFYVYSSARISPIATRRPIPPNSGIDSRLNLRYNAQDQTARRPASGAAPPTADRRLRGPDHSAAD